MGFFVPACSGTNVWAGIRKYGPGGLSWVSEKNEDDMLSSAIRFKAAVFML